MVSCREILPGGFRVGGDLGFQSVQRVEADLVPQMLEKLQAQRLSVQVSLKIQQAGLHGDVRAVVHRGPGAHVGDGGVAGALRQRGPGHVHAVAGHQHMGRDNEVRGGIQAGGADAPPVADRARQGVGMPQKAVGPADLSQLHQSADVRGADGNTAHLHLGDDVAAEAQLRALFQQQLRRALVFVAEMVVVACHQMDGVVAAHQNVRDKFVPGSGHHLPVEGDHDDLLNAVQPAHQLPPVLRRVDEGTGDAGDHFLRRPVKGEHRRGDAPLGRRLHSAPQQSGVAQVDSVEEAQGNDFFLDGHSVTLQRNS